MRRLWRRGHEANRNGFIQNRRRTHEAEKGRGYEKKKKEQEWVEKKKLYRRRGKLLWGQFFVAFIILGWFISGGIIYLANLGHDNKKDLIIVCVAGPLYLIIIVVIVWLIFSEAILPAFRNVKSDW